MVFDAMNLPEFDAVLVVEVDEVEAIFSSDYGSDTMNKSMAFIIKQEIKENKKRRELWRRAF
jgi:hypothetical protein